MTGLDAYFGTNPQFFVVVEVLVIDGFTYMQEK